MSWVRIDDQFPDHPKILTAGLFAELLQIRALCYAARYLTDGFIPSQALHGLTHGMDGQHDWGMYMVSVELWELKEGGFLIHDYLVYNPTREYVLKRKQQFIDAGRASAQSRAQHHVQQDAALTLRQKSAPHPLPSEEKIKKDSPLEHDVEHLVQSIYPPSVNPAGIITRRCSICSYYRAPYTGSDGHPRCRDHQNLTRENKT